MSDDIDRGEEYHRAESLSNEELIHQGRKIFRKLTKEGEHFLAGVVQELWIRMEKERGKTQNQKKKS